MDLVKTLSELHAERERLIKIITALEELHPPPALRAPTRRGRKSMDADAREAVSQRMKRYWASKKQRTEKENDPPGEPEGQLGE